MVVECSAVCVKGFYFQGIGNDADSEWVGGERHAWELSVRAVDAQATRTILQRDMLIWNTMGQEKGCAI
jgi:hypothetical protein